MFVDDHSRLRDMLDYAREATSLCANRTKDEVLRDRMRTLALIRCVEVIGEAAGSLTSELTEAHPEIPWPQIVAMRNRLIHGYATVDLDRLWTTVQDRIPELIVELEKMLDAGSEKT